MDRKQWELIYSQKCDDIKQYPSVLPAVDRIIVIGDLHGDWEMTIKSLKIASQNPYCPIVDAGNSCKFCGYTEIHYSFARRKETKDPLKQYNSHASYKKVQSNARAKLRYAFQ